MFSLAVMFSVQLGAVGVSIKGGQSQRRNGEDLTSNLINANFSMLNLTSNLIVERSHNTLLYP
jgi:hypothetical protein